jgi:transposase
LNNSIKKTRLKPWKNREWCIPPETNAEFVAGMEDVLDVYTQERNESAVGVHGRMSETADRTRKDWAEQVKRLVAEEARRLRDKPEIQYTPKHGSWLNMAEIALNVINNHGLSARIPMIDQMRRDTKAWNRRRNQEARKINWRFTTADARIKLKRLYPQFE